MVIGRFAPSPSGRMHLGNVMTALLAWLSVRSQGGEMVLRIEDLDIQRCKPEYTLQLKEDLQWLGLDWDREQTQQSLKTPDYDQFFADLQAKKLVYPCYCTRQELHASSAPHGSDGRVLYAGTCRDLPLIFQSDRPPAWRLKVPNQTYGFTDGLQGDFGENLKGECGDFLIRRADGNYAYQLAVVYDDVQAGVTEVVRGLDLLDSTPRQLYLYDLLGAKPPKFYHTPLLVAPDGRRLSKREKDMDMGALRQNMTAEELIGHLGYAVGILSKNKPISAKELVSGFNFHRVSVGNIQISL